MNKPRKFTDLRWKMGSPEMVLVLFDEKEHKILGITKSTQPHTATHTAFYIADEIRHVEIEDEWDTGFDYDRYEEEYRFGKTWYSRKDIILKTSVYCNVVQFKNVKEDYERLVKRREVFDKYKNRPTQKCRRKRMVLKFLKAQKDISFLESCDPSYWFFGRNSENISNNINKKDDDWE